MRLIVLSFAIIVSLGVSCKSAPKPVMPEVVIAEEPPEELDLSADELKIYNEAIDHVLTLVTRELGNSRSEMQVCIDTEYYLYRAKSAGSYEDDLANAEQYIRNEIKMPIDEEMLLSFIKRNAERKTFDKDIEFKADFFWKGKRQSKNFFRITLSSIGFSKNCDKAIVHVCVDLPGWIFYELVYLEKRNEDWTRVSSKSYTK